MKNSSNDNFYHIGRASQLLSEIYDLDIDIKKTREAAFRIVQNSGAVRSKTYLLRSEIKDFKVTLPCEVDFVHSVTGRAVTEKWLGTFRDSPTLFQYFDLSERKTIVLGTLEDPDAIQTLPNWTVFNTTDILISLPNGIEYLGTPHAFFSDYSLDKNVMTFNKDSVSVDVIFSVVTKDELNFPYLSEKAIWAVVQYMVYLDLLKKFYKKEIGQNAVIVAKDEYDRAIAQAKSPEFLTANQSDDIMRTLLSKSRHKFGNPFKG